MRALLASAVLLSLGLAPCAAHSIAELAKVRFGAAIHDVEIEGDLAYAIGGNGLHALDISDPSDPRLLGRLHIPAGAEGLAVEAGRAYVGSSRGLFIADVSDPENMILLGDGPVIELWDTELEVRGTTVFAVGISGFRVIDASGAPVVRQLTLLPEIAAHDLDLVGPLGFLATNRGLEILDLSQPAFPRPVGILPFIGAWQVHVSGDVAYVTRRNRGVLIVDVADPALPVEIGSFDASMPAEDIHVSGEIALVAATEHGGLRAFDVSDPGDVVPLGAFGTYLQPADLERVGDVAYLANAHLRIFDVSDPTLPAELERIPVPADSGTILIEKGLAYVGSSEGLHVVDVRDPKDRRLLGTAASDTKVFVFQVAERKVLTAVGSELRLYDATDPSAPVLAASFPIAEPPAVATPVDLVARHGFTYVIDTLSRLWILEGEDPAAMTRRGSIQMFRARGVDVAGHYALVAADGGVIAIDVSDPTDPVEAGRLFPRAHARGIRVQGSQAFVIGNDYRERLLVLDVSDPRSPSRLSVLAGAGRGRFFLERSRLYMADNWMGARILDVSDPTLPDDLVARKPPTIGGLAAHGRYVFGTTATGIAVIDFGSELALPLDVPIDVRPRSRLNILNPESQGRLAVALLASPIIDPRDVDLDSLAFGPRQAAPLRPTLQRDVNGDQQPDLVLYFQMPETGIEVGDVEGCLSGATLDGEPFEGCDSVWTTSPPCGSGFELALLLSPLLVLRSAGHRRRRPLRRVDRRP